MRFKDFLADMGIEPTVDERGIYTGDAARVASIAADVLFDVANLSETTIDVIKVQCYLDDFVNQYKQEGNDNDESC